MIIDNLKVDIKGISFSFWLIEIFRNTCISFNFSYTLKIELTINNNNYLYSNSYHIIASYINTSNYEMLKMNNLTLFHKVKSSQLIYLPTHNNPIRYKLDILKERLYY